MYEAEVLLGFVDTLNRCEQLGRVIVDIGAVFLSTSLVVYTMDLITIRLPTSNFLCVIRLPSAVTFLEEVKDCLTCRNVSLLISHF